MRSIFRRLQIIARSILILIASLINTACSSPMLLSSKLRGVIKSNETISHTYYSSVNVQFTFNASPRDLAPSAPISLSITLEDWLIDQIKTKHSLQFCQCTVDFQCFPDRYCTIVTNFVAKYADNKSNL